MPSRFLAGSPIESLPLFFPNSHLEIPNADQSTTLTPCVVADNPKMNPPRIRRRANLQGILNLLLVSFMLVVQMHLHVSSHGSLQQFMQEPTLLYGMSHRAVTEVETSIRIPDKSGNRKPKPYHLRRRRAAEMRSLLNDDANDGNVTTVSTIDNDTTPSVPATNQSNTLDNIATTVVPAPSQEIIVPVLPINPNVITKLETTPLQTN